MKGLEFPIIGTKVPGLTKKFNLNSPDERKLYFEAKVGDEIKRIKKYMEKGTFVAFMMGKKNSGKGTYSKLFKEIFGGDRVDTISVGDLVRATDTGWKDFVKTPGYDRLKLLYRGYISFDEAVEALTNRSTTKLLPTEFILALMKVYMESLNGKCVFIDGLPRELDQVSYSLYFRDLINYRDDPDVFVLIDIPESVIDERIKTRVICPKCNLPRSTKLFLTNNLGYDVKNDKFYLRCDNPECGTNERLVPKEGDNLGIKPIRQRLEKDEELLKKAFALYGVPKVLLRNHVPVSEVAKYYDQYELTPEYLLSWDERSKQVKVDEKSWTIKDDNGTKCHSLLAAPVTVSMIKQMVEALEI